MTIILTWNNVEDTFECLESLNQIPYGNHKMVVVDNGSTDKTVSVIEDHFPEVHIIENKRNLGYAQGNNIGINYALSNGAEYILLLNNDAIIDPNLLDIMVETAQNFPAAGIFSPTIFWYNRPETVWFQRVKWNTDTASFLPIIFDENENNQVYRTDFANGSAMFFRSDVVKKTGFFDARFFLTWEEVDWCYRAKRQNYEILSVPKAKVWHKVSRSFEDGGAGNKYQYYYTRNRLLWIEKNLSGEEKTKAYIRSYKELYWRLLDYRKQNSSDKKTRIKPIIDGTTDYLLRRFGQSPKYP